MDPHVGEAAIPGKGKSDRSYWIGVLTRLAAPVLTNLAERRLKLTMPVERKADDRTDYSYLEAFGRTLAGIAPWLEASARSGEEERLREPYAELARQAIDAATDPASADYLNFSKGQQPIVDAAFLAHAIIRAPNTLWQQLDSRVRLQLVRALQSTRTRKPDFSNWLLFSAMIETALYRMGADWDPMRIDYALKQHEQWYLGDGAYGDGPAFHADYYNSFVIQPMLIDIIETVSGQSSDWADMKPRVIARAKRHAAVLERSISPEGTFPVIGRSLAYRFGAFQLLAQMAVRRELPEGVHPAQVRSAMTLVMQRMIEAPGTFDEAGWLRIGFCGHQPGIGESYISTGSLYLCATALLPLGLPEEDPFWREEYAPWTSRKAWSGMEIPIDKAMSLYS